MAYLAKVPVLEGDFVRADVLAVKVLVEQDDGRLWAAVEKMDVVHVQFFHAYVVGAKFRLVLVAAIVADGNYLEQRIVDPQGDDLEGTGDF